MANDDALNSPLPDVIFDVADDEEIPLEKQDVNGPLRHLMMEAKRTTLGKRYVTECQELFTSKKRRKITANNEEEDSTSDEDISAMFRATPTSAEGDHDPIEKQKSKISKHPGTIEIFLSVIISLHKISRISNLTDFDTELKNLKIAGNMAKLYKHMSYLLYPNLLEDDLLCERWKKAKEAMGALCIVAFWDTPGLLVMSPSELHLLKIWWEANGNALKIKKIELTWEKLLIAIRRRKPENFQTLIEKLKKGE